MLVFGDVMLDHFVVGRVTRISPEAPVPVVCFDHDDFRLGGAANVAHNLVSLGARVQLVGVIVPDDAGGRLIQDLARLAIGIEGVVTDPKRCTTRKLRVVTERNQQVSRIDYEADHDVPADVEETLAAHLTAASDAADVIVVSDYLKGVVPRGLAAHATAVARRRGIPILIDPKVPHVEYYRGASLITPNHHEAEAVTLIRIRTAEDARAAARAFRERAGCESVLITRGEHGMWLLDGADEADVPAAAREVADVTGAGDTVVATLALGLAAGGTLRAAATLANHAAGIVVARFGAATVTPDELSESVRLASG